MSGGGRGANPWLYRAEAAALPALTVALGVFFSVLPSTSESFPTVANLQITLANQAVLIVIAMAALIPLMSMEYDFSVGAAAGFGSILVASEYAGGHSTVAALGIAVAVGVVIGLANGLLVTTVKVNSVVTTLGTATLLAGFVGWKSGGKSVVAGIPDSLTNFASHELFYVPQIFYIAVAVTAAVYYLLRHTPYGRHLEAIGVNPQAARLLGIRVERQVLISFLISGVLATAGGLLVVAQTGAASPSVGPSFTLPAIAAAFLSVAAIQPGRFNVWGTFVAILFLAILNSGLTLAGANPYVNNFANGGALIVGVAVASLLGRRRQGTA